MPLDKARGNHKTFNAATYAELFGSARITFTPRLGHGENRDSVYSYQPNLIQSNGGSESTRLSSLTSYVCLQGSPSMNSLSTPTKHFLNEARGSFIGLRLPLATSSRMPSHITSVGPHPAGMQSDHIRRKGGRTLKHGRSSAVSRALLPSTSCPMLIVWPSEKQRGRSPGTGRKLQLVSHDELDRQWQGLDSRVITIAAGQDVKREIMLFAQRHRATVILTSFGAISAVNVATGGSHETTTHRGYFTILSLVGNYRQNADSPHGLDGGVNVVLADPNGVLICGRIERFMIAVEPIEVVVGTF